jgi:hypothetical protein
MTDTQKVQSPLEMSDCPKTHTYIVAHDRFCSTCGGQDHEAHTCAVHKTVMCTFWTRGLCDRSPCTFAHGERELRSPGAARDVKVTRLAEFMFSVRHVYS